MSEHTMTTYKRADGETIAGEYGWVTDLDYFDEVDERTEVIVEVWHRASCDVIEVGPPPSCAECGEDVDAEGALCPECASE